MKRFQWVNTDHIYIKRVNMHIKGWLLQITVADTYIKSSNYTIMCLAVKVLDVRTTISFKENHFKFYHIIITNTTFHDFSCTL